jgi:predicted metal-dependent phosphoesterase TrpH
MIDLELHSHTHYSIDSLNRLADIVRACRAVGIDRIAVTDHNEIAGALKAHAFAPDLVIVGEEVKTTQGELLCLFINELIPRGLAPEEAIERTHVQGGIVGAPHPLDPIRSGLGRENLLRLGPKLDFVEVYNARTLDTTKNTEADELARQLGLPRTSGSDAHLLREIGGCRVRMRPYTSPQDFLVALHDAELITHAASPLMHVGSRWAAIAHSLGVDKEHKD